MHLLVRQERTTVWTKLGGATIPSSSAQLSMPTKKEEGWLCDHEMLSLLVSSIRKERKNDRYVHTRTTDDGRRKRRQAPTYVLVQTDLA